MNFEKFNKWKIVNKKANAEKSQKVKIIHELKFSFGYKLYQKHN